MQIIRSTTQLDDAVQHAVRIDTLGAQLLAASRREQPPAIAAALAAAGAQLRATHARLHADLVFLAQRPEQRAVLAPDTTPLVVGALRVDRAARAAWLDGRPLALSNLEYELLCVLAGDPQRLFTKAQLYRAVWNGDFTQRRSRTLDSHLCRVRSKLGGKPWVQNRWGAGYSLLPAAPALTEASA
jgi:DNA-binding response OmpR family regulator